AKAAVAKVAPAKSVPPRPERSRAARVAAAAGAASRRAFLAMLSLVAIGWLALTAGAGALLRLIGRVMLPHLLAEPPRTLQAGSRANCERGGATGRGKAGGGFWIVRSDAYAGLDKVYAVSTICTPLGCPPNWLAGEQKFKCPCHGSGFYISGVNFEGPAPRPLERFKVSLADDGQMIVDKSQKFQQELDQWSDPDSFITA